MLKITLIVSGFLVASAGLGQTTSAEKVADVSPWSASYSNYMNGPTLEDDSGAYSINHYFQLSRQLGDWSTAFVLRPDQNLGDYEGEAFEMGDSYIKVSAPSAEIGPKISTQIRVYLPTSKESQEKGLQAKINPRIYVAKSVGPVGLLYLLIPNFYFYDNQEDSQTIASHGHWLSASYNATDWISIDFALYPNWSYKRGEDPSFGGTLAYPGVTAKLNEQTSLSAYLELVASDYSRDTTMIGGALSYKIL